MHDPWTDQLSDYIDGGLPAGQRAGVEQHLAECAECRDVLADLQAVVGRASELGDAEPPRDLWGGIVAGIEASRATPITAARSARRFTFSAPQLAAAAVLIMALTGTAVWYAAARSTPALASGTVVQAAGSARPVAAEPLPAPQYSDDVAGLERALEQNRAQLDPATVEVIERSLESIDRAIDDARAALESDPGNPYLHRQLDNTMRKKVDILRRATRAS